MPGIMLSGNDVRINIDSAQLDGALPMRIATMSTADMLTNRTRNINIALATE